MIKQTEGPLRRPKIPLRESLINKRFGRLLVLDFLGISIKNMAVWNCLCDCGNFTKVITNDLKGGNTSSCGCLHKELSKIRFTTHGQSLSKNGGPASEYAAWYSIKVRCYNSKNKNFHRYGGRGIKICDRWLNSFENFIADMGKKPSKNHSLDRIDNNGNYEPANCRWATRIEQQQNTNKNVWLQAYGERMILADWARRLNVRQSQIRYHLSVVGRSMENTVDYFRNRQNQ